MNITKKYNRFFISVFCFLGILVFIRCPLFEPPGQEDPGNGIFPLGPEIEVRQGSTIICSGGDSSFGNICINTSYYVTFTIGNLGTDHLNLTGTPDKVVKSGPDASLLTITSQPSSPISQNGSTQFYIRFSTASTGQKTATLTIANDDPDENPYTSTITATGIVPPAKIPATGQTTSYAAGDDGDLEIGISWPVSRFVVDIEDVTVTDNLTGLMWQKTPSGAYASWSSRIYYANDLILDDHDDWRLPNVIELQSLINSGEQYPGTWLNNQGFTSVLSNDYWSSTQSASDVVYARDVRLGDAGCVARTNKPAWKYGWAVRDGQAGTISLPKSGQTSSFSTGDDGDLEKGVSWPSPRFIESGNGIVTDNLTGLVWEQTLVAITRTWEDAVVYGNELILGGYFDWRLPNKNELRSLINYGSWNSATWLGW